MQYRIFEANLERLEKKLQRISNKCKKYGNDFTYEKIGEEFAQHEDENGNKYTVKYIIVEAEGTAIINDWKFIATVQHTENGNIIKSCCNTEVPQRYYTAPCTCEHCNSKRLRKDTYIVQNTINGEFKQVGKSCLKDFTCGMSAEGIASYISLFDELIAGEKIEKGYHTTEYIKTTEALRYIAETIKHFGYVKSDDKNATKTKAKGYYQADNALIGGVLLNEIKKEMRDIVFDHNSTYSKKLTEDALEWIKLHDDTNNYFHNLKTACGLEYITFDNFGLLASLFPAFERENKKTKNQSQDQKSEYVGNVGDRITVQIADFTIVTSWETDFGTTFIYKITDTTGNIYTWKTSVFIADETKEITGTVKSHNDYKGAKQTELTRCRIK